MSPATSESCDGRQHARLKLPAMYTLVRVKVQGQERFAWTGYIYDISASGMRFELDAPLAPGTPIEVRAMLPGATHTTIQATGRVIRLHDEEAGPVRMGMVFEKFVTHHDRRRLMDYLEGSGLRLAA